MAVRSKDYVYSRLIAAILGSNPAEGVDVRLLYLLCVLSVAVSAKRCSLVQKSPAKCVCVSARVCARVCVRVFNCTLAANLKY